MVRVAIVGTGWWGFELGKAAKAAPDRVDLIGCTSLSRDECARFKASFGGEIIDSYEQVLADSRIDAVVLATPHSTHVDQIVRAAAAGKHVFCEKPLALTVAEARRAAQACADAGRVLAVGHNRRYGLGARRMKALVDAGECGKIIHVDATYSGSLEGRYPPGHWRVQQSEVPAGGLTPMGLHMVDTLTWILGPIVRVASIAKRQATSYALNDTCASLFELAGGQTGFLASHLACPTTAILRFSGTRANLEARDNFTELTLTPLDTARPTLIERYTRDDTLEQEFKALDDACAGRMPYPIRPEEAVRNIAVLEAINKSSLADGAWTHVVA
jgi:predicted dehydrogenase